MMLPFGRNILNCFACITILLSAKADGQSNDELFPDCSLDQYYEGFEGLDPTQWDRLEIATLLRDSHRRSLPYTSRNEEDTWDAMIDLDGDPNTGTIRLIYRNIDVPANEYGTSSTWNREHVWPKSRGVGTSGPDYTDVHALRPSDWQVNAARSNLYFGDCGNACTSRPANREAAEDTARDNRQFLPPANVRGDLARAIMYMELRYSFASDPSTNDLTLTDCPNRDTPNQMAYLSQLLQWHEEDPPSDEERARNDRVCSYWQGNRNVFVDVPELAFALHGEPAQKPYNCFNRPEEPEQPVGPPPGEEPEAGLPSPEPSCFKLGAGDVQIVSMSADNPDSVGLVALEDLQPGLKLYMTDKAWTGTEFRTNEGTVMLEVPASGIAQGSIFGYGDPSLDYSQSWNPIENDVAFSLSVSGDSVIVYCEDENTGRINHLGALISGEWDGVDDAADLNSNESLLPDDLSVVGSIEIVGGWDNLVYVGSTSGSKGALLGALADQQNWILSNSDQAVYSGPVFQVSEQSSRGLRRSVGSMLNAVSLVGSLLAGLTLFLA